VGIVASVLIALLFDFLLVRLGKLVMPWHDTTRARAPLSRLRRYAVRGGA